MRRLIEGVQPILTLARLIGGGSAVFAIVPNQKSSHSPWAGFEVILGVAPGRAIERAAW